MKYKILPMDIESYPNYLLIGIKDTKGEYSLINSIEKLEKWIPHLDKIVFAGYNSINYDSVIFDYVLTYYKVQTWEQMAKTAHYITKDVINNSMSHFKTRRKYNVEPHTNNVDLAYYCGQSLSLKEAGIRGHMNKLETLPFDPTKKLTEEQTVVIDEYNKNDLDITEFLLLKGDTVSEKVKLKQYLIDTYKLPLSDFAKTDGVLAEEILCDMHRKPIKHGIIRYTAPEGLTFKTQELNDLKETYEGNWFTEDDIVSEKLTIYGLDLQFGMGGLHACISNYKGENLIDIDVASYYPNIVRNLDLLPSTVKDKQSYYTMIDDRVALKKTNIALANAYKVVVNAVFGKLNYKRSKLYDYQALLNVTITGQLLIAKLLEDLTIAGYKVVYINTDGLMIEQNETLGELYLDICHKWEYTFNYILDYNNIDKVILRDVSNYIVVVNNGEKVKYKSKGDYSFGNDRKNNAYHRVVWKALFNYVINNIPIEDTIYASDDITDFIMYIKYGKSYHDSRLIEHDGSTTYFDRAMRFYWSKESVNHAIADDDKGSTKSYSDAKNIKALPLLSDIVDLNDIDYNRYITRAYQKLGELLGETIENNKHIEYLLKILPIDQGYLSAGIGKKRLNKPLLSPDTTTINLNTGLDSEYLVLDIDNPYSIQNNKLLKLLNKDSYIVYSSQYTIDDVFSGKCRYKVIFKYKGTEIPRKKKNVNIECFYKHPVAIAGNRDDGYEYINNRGKIEYIHFNVNDVLEEFVPFEFL